MNPEDMMEAERELNELAFETGFREGREGTTLPIASIEHAAFRAGFAQGVVEHLEASGRLDAVTSRYAIALGGSFEGACHGWAKYEGPCENCMAFVVKNLGLTVDTESDPLLEAMAERLGIPVEVLTSVNEGINEMVERMLGGLSGSPAVEKMFDFSDISPN